MADSAADNSAICGSSVAISAAISSMVRSRAPVMGLNRKMKPTATSAIAITRLAIKMRIRLEW